MEGGRRGQMGITVVMRGRAKPWEEVQPLGHKIAEWRFLFLLYSSSKLARLLTYSVFTSIMRENITEIS